MKYKKLMIMLVIAIFLFTIASASAGDVNDAAMASEDTSQNALSFNGIAEDNLQTTEKTDERVSAQTGTDV